MSRAEASFTDWLAALAREARRVLLGEQPQPVRVRVPVDRPVRRR